MRCSRKALRLSWCVHLPISFAAAVLFLLISVCCASRVRAASTTPTTTAFIAPSSPVPSGSVCVLKASVTANGTPVTQGFVTFKEGALPLGQAVLQSDGTATLKFWLPPGAFSITANFNGSNGGAPSVSTPAIVTQAGGSATALAISGSPGSYTLNASVTGNQTVPPTGTVTFTDQTTNTVLGTANLMPGGVTSDEASSAGTPSSSRIGDFNGDGRTDYMAQGNPIIGQDENTVIVYLGNADGTFTPVTTAPFLNPYIPIISAIGDFNGDGRSDVLIDDDGTIYTLLSNGDGTFTDGPVMTGLSNFPYTATPGDFNGDGKLDILIPNGTPNELDFMAGNGDGTFQAPVPAVHYITPVLSVQDLDRDGNLDLLANSIDPVSLNPGPYTFYLGQGNGTGYTQQPQSIFGSYAPIPQPTIADFNGDGIPDLGFYDGTSSFVVLFGDGKGGFNAQPTAKTTVGSFSSAGGPAMDVNGDGITDVVLYVEDPAKNPPPGTIFMIVLTGDGTGHFTASSEQISSPGPTFTHFPVPITFPSLGYPLFTQLPPVATATATLSGVNFSGNGAHSIVATYSGNAVLTPSASAPAQFTSGVNFPQGFFAGAVQQNGSAKMVGSAITLTDGSPNEAGSFFYPTPQYIVSFETDFTFQLINPQADGFTFTIQNDSPAALGGTGGSLGYEGIPNSLAIKFDLYNNAGEGVNSIGLYANGATPTVPATNLTGTGIDLHSGHVFSVHILYSQGYTFAVTITDTQTNATVTENFQSNALDLLNTTTAYVGFTGGSGGLTATQEILSWSYSPLPDYPSMYPEWLTYNGGAKVNWPYAYLHLIDSGVANEARSVYFSTPVDIRQFTNDFTFQASNAIADGFTFVLQNAGLDAVGSSGGGLGYGPDTPYSSASGGIASSAAIKFDFYSNMGEGNDSTGLYLDGASPTLPATDLTGTGIALTSGDIFAAHMTYDGTTLTVKLTDTNTGAVATQTYSPVNLPAAVGGNTAYIGFTAGTGALSASENILGWTYVPVDGSSPSPAASAKTTRAQNVP